jgi:RimJ/RimL family protein N-acetyltransferase
MGAMTAPTLVGPRVTLRAFVADDRAARQRHGWHREIERGYGEDVLTRAMTHAEVRSWADHLAARTAAGASCWAVESDGELAGAAFLYDVREAGRKARLAIGMYAPYFLGRGLGTESVRLVLRHAFGTLGMHRVDLRVLDFNDRAIAAYRACGFVEEGRERESCWVEGRWHDDVIMGVLDREFAVADEESG